MNTRNAGIFILVLMFLTVISTSTYVVLVMDDSEGIKIPNLYKTFKIDNIISSFKDKDNSIKEVSSEYIENEKKTRVVEEVISKVVKKEKEMIPFAGDQVCFSAENSIVSADMCPAPLAGNDFGSNYSGADFEVFTVFSNQTGMIANLGMFVTQNFTTSSSSAGNPIGHDTEAVLENSQVEVKKRVIIEPYVQDYFQIKYTVKNLVSPYFRDQGYFKTASDILRYEFGRDNQKPAVADLDNDGDMDLAVAENSAIEYFENQGNNTHPNYVLVDNRQNLTDLNLFQGYFSGGVPQFADIDDDGDEDLFFGMDTGDNIDFYENIGTSSIPSFLPANNTIIDTINTYNKGLGVSERHTTFQILDYDNDGDFDIMLKGNSDKTFAYFENIGTVSSPSWSHVNITVPTLSAYPTFVKYGADNIYDIYDDGSFYENTGTALSPVWTKNSDTFISHIYEGGGGISVYDLDNDGDEDMIFGVNNTIYLYSRGKSETLKDVRIGEYMTHYIANTTEDGQVLYDASEDMMVIIPEISQQNKGSYIYADKQSVSHGLSNNSIYGGSYGDTYNALLNRIPLNGVDNYTADYFTLSGEAIVGIEYGLGDIPVGGEESVTITFKFGTIAGRGNADLYVDGEDIRFDGSNISFEIDNLGNNTASDFKILFIEMDANDVVKTKEEVFNGTIKSNGMANYSTVWAVEKGNTLMVVLDPDNDVYETNEVNNKAEKIKYRKNVYVVSDVEPTILNSLFEQYVKEKLEGVNIVDNENDADYVVHVGNNPYNSQTLDDGWGYTEGMIKRGWKKGRSTYNGLVDVFKVGGKTRVMVEGVGADGLVAALKRVDYSALENNGDFVNKKDADGIEVFEWFRLAANKPYLYQNNQQFYDIVSDALYGKYSEDDKLVKTTGGIMLRLKNLGTYKSSELREYEGLPDYPVVMAGGLWSDISTWENLGEELADSGRDVWLAEITGGPYAEVGGYDYTYSQVINEHVPAIVGGVLNFTGKSQIQYVGHSNGGRSMLDTLSAYSSTGMANSGWYCNATTCAQSDPNWLQSSFGVNPVETYVGAGVPGAFEELTLLTSILNESGEGAIQFFNNINKEHVSFKEVAKQTNFVGKTLGAFSTGDEKISVNLFSQYYDWINSTNDVQPGINLYLDKFVIIGGKGGLDGYSNDLLVPIKDINSIYGGINSSNKYNYQLGVIHKGMSDDDYIKDFTRKQLNNIIDYDVIECTFLVNSTNTTGCQ